MSLILKKLSVFEASRINILEVEGKTYNFVQL